MIVMFFKRSAAYFSPRIGSLAKYGTKGASPEVPKEVALEGGKRKQPFKVNLEAGKKYSWCACGHAKTALCDGTHKDQTLNIKERPVKFVVEKTRDYWLCTCRHTQNAPFCDGSHKHIGAQEASSKENQS